MTHKEATKNLMELQIRLINDNSEEATEYNKKIYDTLAYFITQTIPSSVIEDIKAEIERKRDRIKEVEPQSVTASMSGFVLACSEALDIIDKAVKGVDK